MIIIQILGVLLLIAIVVGALKFLFAFAFEPRQVIEETKQVYNSFRGSNEDRVPSRSSRAPYWEQHLIEPRRALISSFDHVQKKVMLTKMAALACVDGGPTPFEVSYTASFERAFGVKSEDMEQMIHRTFSSLTAEQITSMINSVIRKFTLEQKEWFLVVLDRMISHGPRVPSFEETKMMYHLVEDIGVTHERYKQLMVTLH